MPKQKKKLSEKLFESRIVIISGYVDAEKAAEIIFQLLTLSAESEEDIQIFIGSEGGNYLDMMAIYDTLQTLSNDISGTCIGSASGYSAIILASCTKGKRYALTHSKFSLEQPSGVLQPGANQQTEIAIEAREVSLEREIMEQVLFKHTKRNIEQIHRDCEVGIELNAKQAIDYGIIDEILEGKEV